MTFMIKHTLFVILFTMAIFFFYSCSSRQNIYISDTGAGSVSLDINLENMLTSYARDLLGGFSGKDQDNVQLFDIQKIKNTVMELDGVSLTKITSNNSENLHLAFSFNNPASIFKKSTKSDFPNLISFSRSMIGSKIRKRLAMVLTKDNFKAVTTLLGLENSEVLDTFGPQENPYTSSEYLDLMDYMFEEYETSANIRTIIRSSKIIINLKTDGQIVGSKGCKVTDSGSDVIIEIPLLDIVTLEKPIEVFVEWE